MTLALIGALKESLIDSYTSKTDIKTWGAGAAIGGVTFIILRF